ncbi:VWA domain-containing protein [Catellatospora sp. KI3]|uniref:VWA domain-containing protein n=1 Tax=Catellatospora sp. KI3 TaxID=3041620 RepID=UPI002482D3FB|nr:VWA domain-containing protein [Catellatospora sp. KI3]MDI1465761.1 VWA domain-containing protein [Catellatospora sp. KI3]
MITFLSPGWLLALLPVLGLAAAYLGRHLLRRWRRDTAVPFSNLELLRSLVPRGLGWRRHVAAGLFLLGLFALVTALARPSVQTEEPLERATVILAIDVSLSMQADDVAPTRIEAAQESAKSFVDELPVSYNLGLVSFAKSANVLVAPTKDRAAVREAVDGLQLAEATATGEAVFTALDAIRSVPDNGADEPPPARIVLLSDGYRTYGRSIDEAAAAAVEANVPVTTIAFGTDAGVVDIAGQLQRVPVDRQALAGLAETTGGFFYEAASAAELTQVYQDMGSSIGYRTVPREIGQWFGAAALLCCLGAGALSLLWTSRLP